MADVLIKERLLKKIERTLDAIMAAKEEYLTEEEAAKFLGVKVKTLWNKHTKGQIPASVYKLNILGKRMYQKSKLIVGRND